MNMSADAQAPANTPPPRRGTWLRAVVTMADGSTVELRIPGCVAGSVGTYDPVDAGEEPSIVRVEPGGRRRRGGLGTILGGR